MPKLPQPILPGIELTENTVVRLQKPTDRETNRMIGILSRETKGTLQQQALPFLALLREHRFAYDHGNETEEPHIITLFRASKIHKKEEWEKLLALFLTPRNFFLIFTNMPQKEIDLWRETVRNGYFIDSEVDKMMGTKCFKQSGWYSEKGSLIEPLNHYFSVIYRKANSEKDGFYRKQASFIYVEPIYQKALLREFFPDLATVTGTDTLPSDASLTRYNGENTIFAKLPILGTLYEGKMLPHYIGKLPAATVKKAQKMMALPDFFKTYPSGAQAQLSATLLLNYYVFFRCLLGRKKLPTDPAELAKSFFNQTFVQTPYNDFTLPVLMPHIKGIKKSKLEPYNFTYVIGCLFDLLRKHHAKKWLSAEQLIMGIRTMDDPLDESFLLVSTYFIDDMDMRNGFIESKGKNSYIHPGNIIRQLCEPFVKAVLFTLSTLGIVEVAYREPKEGDTSPYDGLQYVRLTELGKYALDITGSYTPQLSENNTSAFELDDQRLLIKVTDEKSPFVPLLADYADSISPTLYSVSYETFLNGCSTRFDVEQKTKMFAHYICKKQPPVWKQFMADVAKRCNPFGIPSDNYILLTIPKDDTELQRLVLGTPSIRRYVLKAEGYMLMVKKDDLAKLSKAMRKYGYIM